VTREPIDIEHLTRQTMGDDALRREVLGLFVEHARQLASEVRDADVGQRRVMFHTLRGAASGVGAFSLAEHATRMEAKPQDDVLLAQLSRLVEETCAYAEALCEG